MKQFDWSLKPLTFCASIFGGIPLHFNEKKKNFTISITFACLIILSNLLINGPRGININKFKWMNDISDYDNSWLFFQQFPDALLQFVIDLTSIIFFVAIPLIHVIFLFSIVLSNSWEELVSLLKEIQNEMELTADFHQKCRQRCIIALLFVLLVI